MQKITLTDQTIEYDWVGAPTQRETPTLVFLHEGLGCASMWRDFPHQVGLAARCPALVYSRAGYGGASPVPVAPRPVSYLEDEGQKTLPALIEALGVERLILIGHSDGASIALVYASLQNPPVKASGVVVMAPHSFVEELSIESIRRAKERFETEDLRSRLARHHGENADCAFWGWSGMWLAPAFLSWNIEARLPLIQAPLLAIQGRNDEYGTLAQLKTLLQNCPAAQSLILDDCGHSPHKDQPQKTLESIVEFVRKINEINRVSKIDI